MVLRMNLALLLKKVIICLLLGWPYWILTNCKSSPKFSAGQLSQISSVISWEPKTTKKPCTNHDCKVVTLASGLHDENLVIQSYKYYSHIGPWNSLPFGDGALESMNAFKKTGLALRANPHSCTIKKLKCIQLLQRIGY